MKRPGIRGNKNIEPGNALNQSGQRAFPDIIVDPAEFLIAKPIKEASASPLSAGEPIRLFRIYYPRRAIICKLSEIFNRPLAKFSEAPNWKPNDHFIWRS
jgi:hypothetical protein